MKHRFETVTGICSGKTSLWWAVSTIRLRLDLQKNVEEKFKIVKTEKFHSTFFTLFCDETLLRWVDGFK
jgi:hypothetical protein